MEIINNVRRIQDIFGNTTRDVTKEDLQRMIYCEAVINESLRLLPPVMISVRLADQNLDIGKFCNFCMRMSVGGL